MPIMSIEFEIKSLKSIKENNMDNTYYCERRK